MNIRAKWLCCWFGVWASVPAVWGAPPKAKVSLHPSVDGVTAGATFEVAIKFQLDEGWHIYWKNAGDSGLPPTIDWSLPAGFEVGELRFPAPKVHHDAGGYQTNVLEGEPVLLQTFTAPRELPPGDKIRMEADMLWLVCQKLCLRELDKQTLELPVVAAAKPANESLFKRARAALPVQPDKAKLVKVTASTSSKAVSLGQTIDVVLEAAVADGHHLQSNKPLSEGLVPTHVFLENDPGLDFGLVEYPPAEERTYPAPLGKVSEYRGKLKFRVPATVRTDATGTSARIAGLLTAQACNDKSGTCFPPEHVEWSLDLTLSGAAAGVPHPSGVGDGSLDAEAPHPDPSPDVIGIPSPDRAEDGPALSAGNVATITPAGSDPSGSGAGGLEGYLKRLGLPGLLLGCFLYGLFINATPCVLPLLSIKVLGFVQQAHESRGRTAILGLVFGLGVMVFFVVLGFLAAAGSNILQFPAAVIALGAVVTAMALSMLGVFTLQPPSAATKLEATIQQEGVLASFGKGALAPVLGFACTGPFMAAMFGWATQQEWKLALVAFLLTGLGMASPYVVFGANPNWLSFLPKPGQWMITFERIMGFLLLGMVLWLLHPLTAQIGVDGLEWTLGFLVVVAMGCWILGKIDFNMETAQRWRYRGGAMALVGIAGFLIYGVVFSISKAQKHQQELAQAGGVAPKTWDDGVPWQPWSPQAVADAAAAGQTVFVDFTAAYCTQCKVNKAVAINTPEVRARMQALGVVPFQADFTNGDPEIFAILQTFSRAGVPMNLIYPAGKPDAPILLETALTKDDVLKSLDQAGPSRVSRGLAAARTE